MGFDGPIIRLSMVTPLNQKRPFTVAHIQSGDTHGGASMAARRLHEGLRSLGVDSWWITPQPLAEDPFSLSIPKRRQWLSRQIGRITFRLGLNFINDCGTFLLKDSPPFAQADVIHLHNIHDDEGGFFNYLGLPLLAAKRRCFWTLHDMWPLTGHCAYSDRCERWQNGCGRCPDLACYPRVHRDGTRWEHSLKSHVWRRARIQFIAPSRWMLEMARKRGLPCTHIPNGLDLQQYKALDKKECRERLQLPADRPLLLILTDSFSVKRKGADVTSVILSEIRRRGIEPMVLTMGRNPPDEKSLSGCASRHFGYVTEAASKNLLFSAASVFLFPSLEDNLPVAVQESLACGTGIVGFDVGGMSDMVKSGGTGELVPRGDISRLADAVVSILGERLELARHYGEKGRALAESHFDIRLVAEKMLELYQGTQALSESLIAG